MPRSRRSLFSFAALLAILLSEMPSSAATLTQTKMVPLQTTGFTDTSSLTFDRFNIAGQQLDTIEFQFSGRIEGGVRLENQSSSARTITTFIGANLTLRRPDNVVLLNLSPRANTSDSLGAYDGVMDFMGSSGVIRNNLVGNQSGTTTIDRPSADLAQFMGPGTFSLLLRSDSDSGDSGGGALTVIFNAMASAEVTVIYTYSTLISPPPLSAVPEPSSFALLGVGGGVTLLFGRWRRRSRRNVA